MKQYRNLLFDIDMTILNYQATEDAALDALFHELGIVVSPSLKASYKKYNLNRWKQYEKGEISWEVLNEHMFDLFLAKYCGVHLDGKMVTRHYLNYVCQGKETMPGAQAMLEKLAPRYQLLAVTNGQERVQWARIKNAHVAQYFDGVYISEAVNAQKPDPAIFRYVFDHQSGVNPKNSLMIGDSLSSDVQGGVNAGIDTLWLDWHHQKEPVQPHPTYTVHNLAEITNLLTQV